jgi:hypothetical protein
MEPWQETFLEALHALSDIERQRSAWVEPGGAWFPDPGELVCQVFDDSSVNELLAEGMLFSAATDDLLRQLDRLADEVDVEVAPEALLASDAWLVLARLAARVRDAVAADLGATVDDPLR